MEPRLITAAEILDERDALRNSGQDFPHNYNARCGVWVSCDCPPCRDFYDPTGEESAKYLNMEFPSWFNGQVDMPSFYFSRAAKESYLAHIKPGFYIGNAKKPATLEAVVLVLTPPFPMKPKRILRVLGKGTWDEFILSEDKMSWQSRHYANATQVFTREEPIPLEELAIKLQKLE